MKKRIFNIILFIIYIICLIDIFLFKINIPPQTGIYEEINLIPFYGENFKILSSLLQIIAFIPFGIYLGLISKRKSSESVAIGFIFIIILETSKHILGTGVLDITNIITNTLGVYLGKISYLLTSKIMEKEKLDKIITITASICTICLITLLIFTSLIKSK
ncbi:MAG: VanZ family protein [Bacilli bacterium]|nr:VanZ family protein [Bacilli bacterium]